MPKDFNKNCNRASNDLASRAQCPDFKFRPVISKGFLVFLRQIPGHYVDLNNESFFYNLPIHFS